MAQQAQQVNISQLPPTSVLYNGDVFVVDQLGGDGYTKQITFSNFYKSLSAVILPDLYNTKVSKSGDTMTGYLTLNGVPTTSLHAATKSYVDSSAATTLNTVRLGFLPLSGGVMTNYLTLNASPTASLHAATKQYVDTLFSSISGAPVTPLVPAGTIIWFAGSTAPAGYLVCNGDTIPDANPATIQGVTADFTALVAVISNTYGNARQLPDMRGLFARGWDAAGGTSKNIDPSRVFGSQQNASLIGFDEGNDAVWNASTTRDNPVDSAAALSLDPLTRAALNADYLAPETNPSNARARVTGTDYTRRVNPFDSDPDSSEGWLGGARPRNIALLPCIKY